MHCLGTCDSNLCSLWKTNATGIQHHCPQFSFLFLTAVLLSGQCIWMQAFGFERALGLYLNSQSVSHFSLHSSFHCELIASLAAQPFIVDAGAFRLRNLHKGKHLLRVCFHLMTRWKWLRLDLPHSEDATLATRLAEFGLGAIAVGGSHSFWLAIWLWHFLFSVVSLSESSWYGPLWSTAWFLCLYVSM